MDDRKDYVAPAIAAEDVLEQTSLACQVTEPYSGDNGVVDGAWVAQVGIYATGLACTTNVNKGGVFIPGEVAGGCSIMAPKPNNLVVLS
jgi:hypothetical protein